jgi:hypothetical protein
MRSTTTVMALAAALLIAPAAMAQTQPGTSGTTGQGGTGTTGGAGMPPATTSPMTPSTGAPAAGTTGGNTTTRDSAPPTTATPAAGANSFTEGQARRRIEDAGYTDVRELKKDEQGVWRGRAMRNGSEADVGLDFQGKVVTGNAQAR